MEDVLAFSFVKMVVDIEAAGQRLHGGLEQSGDLLMSAGTVAEALIVAERRDLGAEMTRLIEGLGLAIVSVSAAAVRPIAASYTPCGKSAYPAGLSFCNCFAYEVAPERDCPLLYF